ncbi:DUF3806 domain-containing protein [Cellvibrio sp. OA-2007]|uniref:DUF3806 domain-containing protein n=1 Tax=Cellvibrio sp. OA-2007 TaxID=529823 RepID=UPI000780745D|nr:DUF3806 domain-containing protein [Cellvibrio sp. OA-2007]
MNQKIEPLDETDLELLAEYRNWLFGHFDDPQQYEELSFKLSLIQTIIDNKWVLKEENFKLQALGVCFGDALEQEVQELSWVAVDDDFGRDPALRWLNTNTLVFPRTAVSKRVEDDIEIDIYEMFGGFQKAIKSALEKQA